MTFKVIFKAVSSEEMQGLSLGALGLPTPPLRGVSGSLCRAYGGLMGGDSGESLYLFY